MVVVRAPPAGEGPLVGLTRGELLPDLYRQFGPHLSDFDVSFKRHMALAGQKNFKAPLIFHPSMGDQETNYFVTEFFDVYPELKISMFDLTGMAGIRLQNRALYKLLYQLFGHYKRLVQQGLPKQRAFDKTLEKFDDHVKEKVQRMGTTQVIASNLQVRPMLSFLQREALDVTRNKLARSQRDVELLKMRDAIQEMEEIDSTVGLLYSSL